MKQNLVLCGFMGCGKSTVGALLAEELHCPCCDLDALIEARAGKAIPQIFEESGEAGFRRLEREAVLSLQNVPPQVIAAGGGTLTFEENVRALQKTSFIIYLDPGFEVCWQRIRHSDRPLVQKNTKSQLEALYRKRDPFYRRAADLTLCGERTPEALCRSILSLRREP